MRNGRGRTVAYHPKPASCGGCPAYSVGKSFVKGEGPADARIVFVGQWPGQDAALDGRPFVGPSGRKLDSWMVRAGIQRHRCGVGNAVWCWLPENRAPTRDETAFCRDAHWDLWLRGFLEVRVVVPVGVPAMAAFLPKELAKADSAGGVFRFDGGPYIVPLLHPADILRGQFAEEPAQVEYLKRVKEIADGADFNIDREACPPEGETYCPRPSLEDLRRWRAGVGQGRIAVDIETAGDHIRLVGLLDCSSLAYLGFPLRTKGGGQYWRVDELPAAVEWLYDLLSEERVGKVFHNGPSFDIPMLERNGFRVRGTCFDTMLGMHVAYPGVPKDLAYLAKLYLGMVGWKGMVKGKTDAEGK